jgi:hypothetical protein
MHAESVIRKNADGTATVEQAEDQRDSVTPADTRMEALGQIIVLTDGTQSTKQSANADGF